MARVLIASLFTLEHAALAAALGSRYDVHSADCSRMGFVRQELSRLRPDLLVVDAHLSPVALSELCRQANSDGCRVLALADTADHRCLIDSLDAGAQGFVSKESSLAELSGAIDAVLSGGASVPPPMLAGLLLELVGRRRETVEGLEKYHVLSRREKEVLGLLAEGLDHHAIAERLVISPQTARTHLQNAMSKLGVHSRLEAAAFVLRHGLVDRPVS